MLAAADTLAFNRSDTGLTVANVISGATGIVSQLGTGTTTLTGANTYGGATNVNLGTLVVSLANQSNTLPSASPVTLAGGTLQILGASGSANAETLTGITTFNAGPG